MAYGADSFRHDVPQEFSDEDRWQIWRISLPRKSFVMLLAGGGVTYLLFKGFALLHLAVFGVVLGLVLTLMVVFLTLIPIPESDYIKGGGLTLDIILIRRMVRRRNRVVYVKGIADNSKKRRKG